MSQVISEEHLYISRAALKKQPVNYYIHMLVISNALGYIIFVENTNPHTPSPEYATHHPSIPRTTRVAMPKPEGREREKPQHLMPM